MEGVHRKKTADLDLGRRPELKTAVFFLLNPLHYRDIRDFGRDLSGDFQTLIGISSQGAYTVPAGTESEALRHG